MKKFLATAALGVAATSASQLPVQLETRAALDSRVSNIHLSYRQPVEEPITVTYGSCHTTDIRDAHHVVSRAGTVDPAHDRLVWVMPKDVASGGCLSAWGSSGSLLGRSKKQEIRPRASSRRALNKRSSDPSSNAIPMTNASGIDAWGAWFDGVEHLQSLGLSSVDVAAAKEKNVAIVGAGMSGLMTWLCLSQAGFTNLSIIEAGERLGGRVHTVYLTGGPFDYSYQEMGPMRFPYQITLGNDTLNVTDHQMVFQLADELNKINGFAPNWTVSFIPWYQSSDNGLYYHNGIKTASGLPPTVAQVAANASLSPTLADNPSTTALNAAVDSALGGDDFTAAMATNMFKAHRQWLDNGLGGLPGDQWSEYGFMVNYLKGSLNDSDIISKGYGDTTFWNSLYEGMYFTATEWLTIDGGLNRLPYAFHPLVDSVVTMNRSIERIRVDAASGKITLQSRPSYSAQLTNTTHDYAVVSVPFSVLKNWRIDGLPTTLSDAIVNVPYTAACKVALEFATRFWEHLPNPIYGSCSTSTDIPGIGSVCYPSYNINGTGPASIIGSYISGNQWGERWASLPEEEHVRYVLDAMVEIHGDVAAREYTGKFNRLCWNQDPLEVASWASPSVGQHELYLPEYFKTHNNMIFVGEHTSYTHAWIASALESGIRGSVQLMLELGLVDEAKATVEKWMARWIEL